MLGAFERDETNEGSELGSKAVTFFGSAGDLYKRSYPGDTRTESEEDCGLMRGKITKRTVHALAPRDSGEVVLWGQEVRGFGIRARVGGAKDLLPAFSRWNGAWSPTTQTDHWQARVGLGRPIWRAPRQSGCWVRSRPAKTPLSIPLPGRA
jgi:hypothetical protein